MPADEPPTQPPADPTPPASDPTPPATDPVKLAADTAQPAANPVNYHPQFVRVFSVLVWLACLVWLWQAVMSGPASLALQLPVIAWLVLLFYVTFWRPGVVIDDDGVSIVNVMRTVRVPFGDLEAIDTRFTFTVTTKSGKKYRAWAAPTGSAVRTLRWSTKAGMRELGQAVREGDEVRASELPGSDSGNAAAYVAQRWADWQNRRRTGELTGPLGRATARWHWLTFAWFALCVYAIIIVPWWLSQP